MLATGCGWLIEADHRFAVRPVASSIGDIFHCLCSLRLAAISDRTTLEPIGDFPTEEMLKKEVGMRTRFALLVV